MSTLALVDVYGGQKKQMIQIPKIKKKQQKKQTTDGSGSDSDSDEDDAEVLGVTIWRRVYFYFVVGRNAGTALMLDDTPEIATTPFLGMFVVCVTQARAARDKAMLEAQTAKLKSVSCELVTQSTSQSTHQAITTNIQ